MNDAKLLEVIGLYEREVPILRERAISKGHHDIGSQLEHVIDMLPEMRVFIADSRYEKVMRWLGFVQGVLWSTGAYTLDELKAHNAPEEISGHPV